MVTDDDREFARRQASLIYENHRKRGGVGCDANHIAIQIGYEETLRRGLLTECAFAHEFGVEVNSDILDYGDGGRDFLLWLFTASGRQPFTVNVKAKSVQMSWEGLKRSGTHLRVPVSECRPRTIYVFGIYLEPTDEAEVLAWDWGLTLIRQNERRQFDGPWNYVRLFDDLRDLEELKARLVLAPVAKTG